MKIELGDVSREIMEKPGDSAEDPSFVNMVRSLYRPRLEFVRFLEGVVQSDLSVREPESDDEFADEIVDEQESKPDPDVLRDIASTFEALTGTPPMLIAGKSARRRKLFGEWSCNYHLETVATLSPQQANSILFGVDFLGRRDEWSFTAPTTLDVTLSYPLSVNVKVRISPPRRMNAYKDETPSAVQEFNSFGLFLLSVAKEYERIYSDQVKHGVWGHGIGDLYFERVLVRKDGSALVSIGS